MINIYELAKTFIGLFFFCLKCYCLKGTTAVCGEKKCSTLFQFSYSFNSCTCILFLQCETKGASGEAVKHTLHTIQFAGSVTIECYRSQKYKLLH